LFAIAEVSSQAEVEGLVLQTQIRFRHRVLVPEFRRNLVDLLFDLLLVVSHVWLEFIESVLLQAWQFLRLHQELFVALVQIDLQVAKLISFLNLVFVVHELLGLYSKQTIPSFLWGSLNQIGWRLSVYYGGVGCRRLLLHVHHSEVEALALPSSLHSLVVGLIVVLILLLVRITHGPKCKLRFYFALRSWRHLHSLRCELEPSLDLNILALLLVSLLVILGWSLLIDLEGVRLLVIPSLLVAEVESFDRLLPGVVSPTEEHVELPLLERIEFDVVVRI
jgi:hypothetical protein